MAGPRSDGDRRPGGRSVERRVYVRATPREVWATLHDPAAAGVLFPELALDPPGPSWPAAASIRSGEIRLGLLRTVVRVESLEARPQSTFEIAVTAAGFAIGWRWRMEPIAGGTRVIHEGSFETTDRWTGVLVRIGRESIGSLAEQHLRNLKTRAESAAEAETGPAA
jgi:carbon monoxide dehydrogenase subunit G